MTKKDYELIARCLLQAVPLAPADLPSGETRNGWNMGAASQRWEIANRIAAELEADNPRLDRERFMTACGLS